MGIRGLLSIAAVLLLSGCNSLQFGMDDLLSPPRLSTQQTAIYDALQTAIGADSFKLKYPQRGDYLSACVLHDLDRDGKEEAIVFYERNVSGATSSWMSILVQQSDGGWKSRWQLPGEGSEIDFIAFAPLESTDRDNMIVGWSVAGEEELICRVYRTEEDISVAYEAGYNEIWIDDVDEDGLSDLLLCTNNRAKAAVISLVKYRSGRIVRTSEVRMPSMMTGYAQVTGGKLTEGFPAVFADVYLGEDKVTTILAAVDPQKSIIERIYGDELGIYTSFDRPTPTLYCKDVNGDGLVDIPVMTPLPGYESQSERDTLYLTEYQSILDAELTTVQRSVVNFSGGFQLEIPEAWRQLVTVKRSAGTNEWRFVLFDDELEESNAELLRIKVVSPADYQDKFDTTDYIELASRGVNRYFASLSPNEYPGFSITEAQLRERFSLLR